MKNRSNCGLNLNISVQRDPTSEAPRIGHSPGGHRPKLPGWNLSPAETGELECISSFLLDLN